MIRTNSQLLQVEKPVRAPYGLLGPAVKVVNDRSDWWLGGAIHELFDGGVSYSVLADQGYDPDDVIREMINPVLGEDRFVQILPVTVETRIKTSTLGVSLGDVKAMAEDSMELVLQKGLEEAFWEYLGTKFRALAGEAGTEGTVVRTTINTTPVPSRKAVALLEDGVGTYTVGYRPTFHLPRIVASSADTMLKGDGEELVTSLGSNVIAGMGYSNTGTDGNALPDQQRVAYATGPVTVVLGETILLEDEHSKHVNTSNNVAEILVQKPALIAFSTKDVLSVLVDTNLD